MSANDFVFVLLRVDTDGYNYDADYPVEAVFRSIDAAYKCRDELIQDMVENDEIDASQSDEPDQLFEIKKMPIQD